MVTCTGHIGIHEGADGRTYVRCTDVHDVMAIKPNFLTSMGYHIFLSMVLRARAPSARAELRYNSGKYILHGAKTVQKPKIAKARLRKALRIQEDSLF